MGLPLLLTWLNNTYQGLRPVQVSAGSGSAEQVVALNAGGQVDDSMLTALIASVQAGIQNSQAEIYCGNAFTEDTPQDTVIDGGNATTVYGPFDLISGGYA